MIPVLIITYLDSDTTTPFLADAYVVMMVVVWIFWVVALGTLVRRTIRRGTSADGAPMIDVRPAVSSTRV